MITLKQLRYLEAIAQTGHFGRAAELVHISQPALSAQIRALEDRLGTILVKRLSNGARLTTVGEDIAARAKKILSAVGELQEAAKMSQGVLAGRVRLGIIPSIAPYFLPKLLPELDVRFPQLQLELRETITEQLMRELMDGALDVVILSLPIDEPTIETRACFFDPFVLACAKSRDLRADNSRFPAKDILNEQTLLLMEDGHCLRDQTLKVWESELTGARRSGGVSNMATLTHLVEQDRGVALLPELFINCESGLSDRVNLIRLGDPEPGRQIGVVWRKTHPRGSDFDALAKLVREIGTQQA
ncbi:MAG: hydrogen peroxide-inducible genes activator [Rhizobiales bacterium]|nr:hydrogen peroxide-inducible genes activator [Hyphomicrobiales bacterium]